MTRTTSLHVKALALCLTMAIIGASPGGATVRSSSRPAATTAFGASLAPADSSFTSRAPLVAFTFRVSPIDGPTRALMTGKTWRPGCPVPLARLRLVTVSYFGFDLRSHVGHLVVNADVTGPVVKALRTLYESRFRIRQMRLVDYFAGSDETSMVNDNTSAFNCRIVPNSTVWSQHAYGRALDLNPLENPEVQGGVVDPPGARPWADRSRLRPGMIMHGGVAWRAFEAVGWKWGGDWTSLKDYQHFSANGL